MNVNQILEAIRELTAAASWPEIEAVLARHPNLLDRETDVLLMRIAADQPLESRHHVEAVRALLADLRQPLEERTIAAGPNDDLLRAARLVQRYNAYGELHDLAAAIDALERCVEAMTIAHPRFALAMSALGETLTKRYARTNAIADLERGIDLMRQSAELSDAPEILINLTMGLMARYDLTSELADLDQIIVLCERSLSTSNGRPNSAVFNNLGIGHHRRYLHTGDATELDRALAAWEEGLEIAQHDPRGVVHLLTNISAGHIARFHRFGALTDLDNGIRVSQQALESISEAAPDRPLVLHGLAVLFMERYNVANQLPDLEEGVQMFQEAVELASAGTADLPIFLMGFGTALMQLHEATEEIEVLDYAIEVLEHGVKLTPDRSPVRSRHLSNLSKSLSLRHGVSNDPGDSDRAIALLEEACAIAPAPTPERILIAGNLVEELRRRWSRTKSDGDLQRASELCVTNLQVGLDVSPRQTLRFALNYGHWAFREREWEAVVKAHEYVREARELVAAAQLDRHEKGQWLRHGQGFTTRAAYACAMVGDARQAIVALELGRARLLAETLERDHARLESLESLHPDLVRDYRHAAERFGLVESGRATFKGDDHQEAARAARRGLDAAITAIRLVAGHERFLRPVTWREIEQALNTLPHDVAVVYLLTTTHGSLALLATAEHVQPIWSNLDSVTLDRALILEEDGQVIGGFLPAQLWSDRAAIEPALDDLLSMLGAMLIAPITSELRTQGIRRVIFIPTGRLGLLPLHAASFDSRCLMDDFVVSYAPSLRPLAVGQRDANSHTGEPRFLLVANPTLRGAEAEVAEIERLMNERLHVSIQGEQVTRERVLDAIGDATHLHFACHGSFNPRDPLASCLELSVGETLTLRDLLNRGVHAGLARLAVLSACQTALTDLESLPDEVIGMPAGFLEAGVTAVIATLWSVDDFSTAIVMIRFYELVLLEGQPPAGRSMPRAAMAPRCIGGRSRHVHVEPLGRSRSVAAIAVTRRRQCNCRCRTPVGVGPALRASSIRLGSIRLCRCLVG